MASTRTHFTVGIFMTLGLALAVLLIIWLGMSSFLNKGELFVTYFDESVQGLNVDSPVKYRGVPVGRVKRIRIAPDYRLIEVLIAIDPDSVGEKEEHFQDSVAALASVGITGAMFVEIEKASRKKAAKKPSLSFTPPYPVIASQPSSMQKIINQIDMIASKLNALNVEGISYEAESAFRSVTTAIKDAQIAHISADIQTLLKNINNAASPTRLEHIAKNAEQTTQNSKILMQRTTQNMGHMTRILAQIESMLAANREHFDQSMATMARTSGKAEMLINQSRVTMTQMQGSVQELEESVGSTSRSIKRTAQNIDTLMNSLQNQPSQLLFSTPPPARTVEP